MVDIGSSFIGQYVWSFTSTVNGTLKRFYFLDNGILIYASLTSLAVFLDCFYNGMTQWSCPYSLVENSFDEMDCSLPKF